MQCIKRKSHTGWGEEEESETVLQLNLFPQRTHTVVHSPLQLSSEVTVGQSEGEEAEGLCGGRIQANASMQQQQKQKQRME